MLTVRGKFQDGTIQLLEPAPEKAGDVLIIFLDEGTEAHTQTMVFGMFLGDHQSVEADFLAGEFSGDVGDGLEWA